MTRKWTEVDDDVMEMCKNVMKMDMDRNVLEMWKKWIEKDENMME